VDDLISVLVKMDRLRTSFYPYQTMLSTVFKLYKSNHKKNPKQKIDKNMNPKKNHFSFHITNKDVKTKKMFYYWSFC
jgi:hypothetical protein